jgi:hypothetical protein
MKPTLLLPLILLACLSACSFDSAATVIHVPKRGCPEGWKLLPDVFEYQGKSEPACIDVFHPERGHVTDYLRGGESERMTVPIPWRAPKPDGKGKGAS